MTQISISVESPLTADADRLIQGSEAALRAVYSEDECFTFTAAQLDAPNIDFYVARQDGVAVGCVAMVRHDTYAEVKRLYVPTTHRGLGLAASLMHKLHAQTQVHGIHMMRLETGEKLAAAVGLYRKLGYVTCGPFGDYTEHPASLFMQKELAI